MKQYINSVNQSLESKNWFAALFISLAIPDICVSLEKGKSCAQDYIDWFNVNLGSLYKRKIGSDRKEFVFLTGNDVYSFRCAMLHEGNSNISGQSKKNKIGNFKLTVNNGHCNYNCDVSSEDIKDGDILHLDVPVFCKDICKAAKLWAVEKNVNKSNSLAKITMF